MMAEIPERPVRPKNAASLVILRGEGRNTEVLLGKRASKHRFLPNVFVFPGGRVDTADHSTDTISDLQPHVAEKLERKWTPKVARALATAALRETYEETGLVFGEFNDHGFRPDLGQLDYVARAITPPVSPIRFHARFFSVHAEHASGTIADSVELLELQWITIREALALPVIDVTEFVLQEVERRVKGWQPPGVPLFSYRRGAANVRYE